MFIEMCKIRQITQISIIVLIEHALQFAISNETLTFKIKSWFKHLSLTYLHRQHPKS